MSKIATSKTDWAHKFYHLIQSCDTHTNTVACWSEDGGEIIIKNIPAFEKMYQALMESSSKWSSIVKQLNSYGFQKCNMRNKQDEPEVYAHENGLFRRDGVSYLVQIKKKKSINTTAERLLKLEQENKKLKKDIEKLKKEMEKKE